MPRPDVVNALRLIDDFKNRRGRSGWFYSIPRDQVAAGLAVRIKDPSRIDQGAANLCGPAALLFNLAQDRPEMYARFAIDLFENGQARLKNLLISPGADLRRAVPPSGTIDMADWITLASIRDSENWFGFSYCDTDQAASAITWPNELEKWFKSIGYTQVVNKASKWFTQNRANAEEASTTVL